MTVAELALPGLDRIRDRFIEMLEYRVGQIAQHALAAWDGETAEEINENLEKAKGILHQIAGTAGTVGYPELGRKATECEMEIIEHLDGDYADLAICPGAIVWRIDAFVAVCQETVG